MFRLTCFTAAVCAGCHVDHQQDVDAYRRILDADTPEPRLAADGSLSIYTALAMANRSSESLAINGEAYARSILEKRRAVAAFFPSVDLQPGYAVRQRRPGNGVDADVDVPLTLDLALFDGGRTVNTYWRDVYLVERQRALLLESQESLLHDVADVYYTVIRSQEQVKVLEQSIAVQDERLRDVRGRTAAGVARPLDVAQTEAQYAATRVTLIEARRQVASGRSLLAYLVNRPVEALPLSDGYTPGEAVPPTATLVATARIQRSELAAAERAIAAARRDVSVAIGQYYPEVSLNVSAFLYRESVPSQRVWDGLLEVNFPIFRAGQIDADVRTAWSFLREASLVESQTRRRIQRDIEQTARDLIASRERLNELQVQQVAAAEAFRQADASYRAGRGTNLERVSAQDLLLQAQLQLVTEAIDQKLLRLQLLQASGILRETMLNANDQYPMTDKGPMSKNQ